MLSSLLASLVWLGRIVSILFAVGAAIGKIFDTITKFLSQSKIYFTVLFVSIAIICFFAFERFLNWGLDILGVTGFFEDVVEYGFINEVVNIDPLLNLGVYYLSFWLTEKVFLSGLIGTRILWYFTMGFSNLIHL